MDFQLKWNIIWGSTSNEQDCIHVEVFINIIILSVFKPMSATLKARAKLFFETSKKQKKVSEQIKYGSVIAAFCVL